MEFDKLEQTEAAMNEVIAELYSPNPQHVDILDVNGEVVGKKPGRRIDILRLFNEVDYPDIYNGMKGAIIVVINEDHVRLCRKLEQAKELCRGLKSHKRLIQGPFVEEPPWDEWLGLDGGRAN